MPARNCASRRQGSRPPPVSSHCVRKTICRARGGARVRHRVWCRVWWGAGASPDSGRAAARQRQPRAGRRLPCARSGERKYGAKSQPPSHWAPAACRSKARAAVPPVLWQRIPKETVCGAQPASDGLSQAKLMRRRTSCEMPGGRVCGWPPAPPGPGSCLLAEPGRAARRRSHFRETGLALLDRCPRTT
jgi:hypothetical protein